MFERRHEPVLPPRAFLRRVFASLVVAGLVVACSLGLGVAGYHWIGGLGWIDSILNAAMILTGMGPVDRMEGAGPKLFSAAYALFSGLVFLSTFAIVIAPVVHRMLHGFHRVERKGHPDG